MSARSLAIFALTFLMATTVLLKDSTANTCRTALAGEVTDAQLNDTLAKSFNIKQKEAYDLYKSNTVISKPKIAEILPDTIVRQIVTDSDSPSYSQALAAILTKLSRADGNPTSEQIIEAFREHLTNTVPLRQVEQRLAGLNNLTVESLRMALGKMTIEEVRESLYGNNPLQPTPESLLGRYMTETGARSVVRTFSKGPEHPNEMGPQRLAVAVSPASFETFKKYFANINILMHNHTPRQGTLVLTHNGKSGSYGQHQFQLQTQTEGTILPTILLSTTEGNRAENFFKLASDPNGNGPALTPWTLKNAQNEPYCAMGGYNSCTHWFGNIPVGDNKVGSYTFPGKVDGYAGNNVGPEAQTKPLTQHTGAELASMVWQAPGHEQLHSVLNLERQQVAGELANPGYVAVSLTSQAPVDRVPVVFVFVSNHQAELQPNFDTQISAH